MRTPAFAGYKSNSLSAQTAGVVVSAVIGFGVLFVALVIMTGFVLSQLWAWFVVTSLNAPELSLGESLGIATVVGFFTSHLARQDSKAAILAPLMSLAWGAILHYVFGVGM